MPKAYRPHILAFTFFLKMDVVVVQGVLDKYVVESSSRRHWLPKFVAEAQPHILTQL